MTVTAPIVSQACILRTRLFVRSILRMEMASERVMLMGSPSGTAMTISATETMKMWSKCSAMSNHPWPAASPARKNLAAMTQKMTTATAMPIRPISRESRVNWRSSGVGSSFGTVDCSVTRPASLWSPTAVTTIRPYPSMTDVPRNNRFDG